MLGSNFVPFGYGTKSISMANVFNVIAIVCFIVAAVACIVAIVLFFSFNIKKIISDLSGHTAKIYIKQQKENKTSMVKLSVDNNSLPTVLLEDEKTTVLDENVLNSGDFNISKDIIVVHTVEKL